jgi:hypothetical protein
MIQCLFKNAKRVSEEGGIAQVWTKIARTATSVVVKRLGNILIDVKFVRPVFTFVEECL